ncbi:unnamed protein product, partial [Staurois parvus]
MSCQSAPGYKHYIQLTHCGWCAIRINGTSLRVRTLLCGC